MERLLTKTKKELRQSPSLSYTQLDSSKKHKNINITSLVPLQEKDYVQLQCVFSYKKNIFPKYYDTSEILWCYLRDIVTFRRLLFLFLSQIYSCPIQINFQWIQILQRQQWSKTPFSYTDEDRHKNTCKKYVFCISGNLPTLPIGNPLGCVLIRLQILQ